MTLEQLHDEIQRLTVENERLSAENQRVKDNAEWLNEQAEHLEIVLDETMYNLIGIHAKKDKS